jgi:hypothetical protein
VYKTFNEHFPTDAAQIRYYFEGLAIEKTSWVILEHWYKMASIDLKTFKSGQTARPYDVRLDEASYMLLMGRIGEAPETYISTNELRLGPQVHQQPRASSNGFPALLPIHSSSTEPQHELAVDEPENEEPFNAEETEEQHLEPEVVTQETDTQSSLSPSAEVFIPRLSLQQALLETAVPQNARNQSSLSPTAEVFVPQLNLL